MIKPRGLIFGDTIGIVAPAGMASKEKVEASRTELINMGFKVKLGLSCYSRYGYLAGPDSLRAKDINSMFMDDGVSGIICLRGGYGSLRILDLLDYGLIRRNPKVFIGYSDITALHIGMNQKAKLLTFHGPMAVPDMADGFNKFSRECLYNFILKDRSGVGDIENPIGEDIQIINKGRAKGPIVGGNLSLIVSTLGTPYQVETEGKILFIEEIGEAPYRIDRMFNQLRLAGKLQKAKGIILGDFKNCLPRDCGNKNSLTLDQIVGDIIKPIGKPTIFNLKAGHCKPMITLPLGAEAILDGYHGKLTIREKTIEA